MNNAKIIDDPDNVVVAIYEIKKGEPVKYVTNAGGEESLTAVDTIPLFHKIAREDIRVGEFIIKYGQHIGIAGSHIRKGEHVHTHNVKNVDQS